MELIIKKYKDRHKRIEIQCARCGQTTIKIKRYVTAHSTCRGCTRFANGIKKFTTTRLKEIIDNNGVSDLGTDFEERLDEIKEEYYLRQYNKQEKELRAYNRQLSLQEKENAK